jgi:hypothetical protein
VNSLHADASEASTISSMILKFPLKFKNKSIRKSGKVKANWGETLSR